MRTTSGKRERKRDPLCENCVTSVDFVNVIRSQKKKISVGDLTRHGLLLTFTSSMLAFHRRIPYTEINDPLASSYNNVHVLLLCVQGSGDNKEMTIIGHVGVRSLSLFSLSACVCVCLVETRH